MIATSALLLAGILSAYSASYSSFLNFKYVLNTPSFQEEMGLMAQDTLEKFQTNNYLYNLKYTLEHEAPNLNREVVDKVVTSIECANQYNVEHNQILTVIDYSLPSNKKRLWVFDLEKHKLLYHTYVGHGIASGALLTNNFSNKQNSKATSIGVYRTEEAYYGREGRSLRLQGLDISFNDNASNRYIVMHGGWYMDGAFIKKYGRSGRSWGCPALPISLTNKIIETIKDKSLMIMYYPSDAWFAKSRFLNCKHKGKAKVANTSPLNFISVPREYVLFAPLHKNKAIVALSADEYVRFFHLHPPLKRMLRRRIDNLEYIALSRSEFEDLIAQSESVVSRPIVFDKIAFVIPVIKMRRGYYITELHFVQHEKIKAITMHEDTTNNYPLKHKYMIHFYKEPSIWLNATNEFIRWVGL